MKRWIMLGLALVLLFTAMVVLNVGCSQITVEESEVEKPAISVDENGRYRVETKLWGWIPTGSVEIGVNVEDVGECPETRTETVWRTKVQTETVPAECPPPPASLEITKYVGFESCEQAVEAGCCEPAPPEPAAEEDECVIILAGGRLKWADQAQSGFEWIATADCSWIEAGTGLQPTLAQVTDSEFENVLDLQSDLEVVNDGIQWVVVPESGEWMVYGIPKTDDPVAFWEVSWMQYLPPGSTQALGGGVRICENDTGSTTGWDGDCGGESQTVGWKLNLEQAIDNAGFQSYWPHLQPILEGPATPPFNNKIEVLATFHK